MVQSFLSGSRRCVGKFSNYFRTDYALYKHILGLISHVIQIGSDTEEIGNWTQVNELFHRFDISWYSQ